MLKLRCFSQMYSRRTNDIWISLGPS